MTWTETDHPCPWGVRYSVHTDGRSVSTIDRGAMLRGYRIEPRPWETGYETLASWKDDVEIFDTLPEALAYHDECVAEVPE